MAVADEDTSLLDAWASGDRNAGARLFDRHFAAMSRFFANKAPIAADDLIQQTFLQCVEAREQFRQESSFRTFLFSVARNVLHNHYRGKRRGKVDPDFGVTSIAELGAGASSWLAAKREHRLLLEALRRIPLDDQAVLELYYWERMKAREIAAVLDVAEGTVRSQIRRAKQRLANAMEDLRPDAIGLQTTLGGLDRWASELRNAKWGGADAPSQS